MNSPRGKMCPGITIGQVLRYVVYGLSLAEQCAKPLQITREMRHHDPPGILIVQSSRCIESPSWIFNAFRRVWPSVPHQLVDSLQKVEIGLGLQVERSRSEDRRVDPGPRFRRCYGPAIQVTRR